MSTSSETVKKKHVMVLLIKEILSQLDDVCALRTDGRPALISGHLLREMCSVLKDFTPELEEIYFEVLLAVGANQETINRPSWVSDEYLQSSLQVKQRFLEQIKEELKQLAA